MGLVPAAFRLSCRGLRAALIGCIIFLGCSPYSKEFRNGSKQMMHGDTDGAIVEFTRAIEKRPDDSMAYYNRGCAYFQKEQFDKTIFDLDKFLELAKLHSSARGPRASSASSAYSEYSQMAGMASAANAGVHSRLGYVGALGSAGLAGGGPSQSNDMQDNLEKSLTGMAIRIRAAASLQKAKSCEVAGQIPQALAAYSEYVSFYQRLGPDQREEANVKDMYRQATEEINRLKNK